MSDHKIVSIKHTVSQYILCSISFLFLKYASICKNIDKQESDYVKDNYELQAKSVCMVTGLHLPFLDLILICEPLAQTNLMSRRILSDLKSPDNVNVFVLCSICHFTGPILRWIFGLNVCLFFVEQDWKNVFLQLDLIFLDIVLDQDVSLQIQGIRNYWTAQSGYHRSSHIFPNWWWRYLRF